MPNYFKIGQGNQWLRPVSATCDFRISHGVANSADCTSPAALPWCQAENNFVIRSLRHRKKPRNKVRVFDLCDSAMFAVPHNFT